MGFSADSTRLTMSNRPTCRYYAPVRIRPTARPKIDLERVTTISGGSYNYLCDKAHCGEVVDIPADLSEMAERLAGLPYATKAAVDTAAVIEALRTAQEKARRLADVWHAIEWWDSGDWAEDQVMEVLAAYENPAPNTDPYKVPDRTDLIGKPVKVAVHPWSRLGPKEGIFTGQGEKGFSIRMIGGGLWTWWHVEVDRVDLAETPAP